MHRLDLYELIIMFVIAVFVFGPFNGRLSHRVATQRFDWSLRRDLRDEPTFGRAFSIAMAALLGVFLLIQFWFRSAS